MKKMALPPLEGFLFFSLLLILACGGPEASELAQESAPPAVDMDLTVIVPSGRMRSAPDPQAEVVRQFPNGTHLEDLGEVSQKTTQISFGSDHYDEPWLQVRDSSGKTGWIYAREVAPRALSNEEERQQFKKTKHLLSIFGKIPFQGLQQYQLLWSEATTEAAVAQIYQRGLALRDTLTPLLEHKSYSYEGGPLPDLFWLDDFVPGYVTQLVAEGTVYYLFNDYEQWLQLARHSTGKQDDHFFALMASCFPQDSVEYFYPAWELQTWDYGGHHLLGRGITYDILSDIEQLEPRIPLFSKPLVNLKDQILADLTRPDIHFWEPDSLVKRELDSIIQANWSIFTATDRVALETRRLQLDSAAVHGIDFNARAGE